MVESFYRLSAAPFALNPDPAFLFASRGHAAAYAHLKYGVMQGEGFIVITGEVGAGKTTLVRALLDELQSSQIVAAQLASTQLDADDLLQAVATAFGIATQGASKAGRLATIEAYLTALITQGRRALLIVDEAQNLAPRAIEELRMLSNFQLGNRALLQSFLVGQPELRAMLQAPSLQQLRQRVVSSYHLGPLDAAETQRYVEHRLKHVGWAGDPRLDDATLRAIHPATGGIPRRINALCNRLLLFGYLNNKHQLTVSDVAEVLRDAELEAGPETEATRRAAEALQATAGVRGLGQATSGVPISLMNARLDRIERDLSVALELLRTMSRGQRAAVSGVAGEVSGVSS